MKCFGPYTCGLAKRILQSEERLLREVFCVLHTINWHCIVLLLSNWPSMCKTFRLDLNSLINMFNVNEMVHKMLEFNWKKKPMLILHLLHYCRWPLNISLASDAKKEKNKVTIKLKKKHIRNQDPSTRSCIYR